jgi:hypothetical protein
MSRWLRVPARRPERGGSPKKYHAAFASLLCDIGELLEWRCGKLLAPMFRLMIDFLQAQFHFSPGIRDLLLSVSPAAIDRLLAAEKSG